LIYSKCLRSLGNREVSQLLGWSLIGSLVQVQPISCICKLSVDTSYSLELSLNESCR